MRTDEQTAVLISVSWGKAILTSTSLLSPASCWDSGRRPGRSPPRCWSLATTHYWWISTATWTTSQRTGPIRNWTTRSRSWPHRPMEACRCRLFKTVHIYVIPRHHTQDRFLPFILYRNNIYINDPNKAETGLERVARWWSSLGFGHFRA